MEHKQLAILRARNIYLYNVGTVFCCNGISLDRVAGDVSAVVATVCGNQDFLFFKLVKYSHGNSFKLALLVVKSYKWEKKLGRMWLLCLVKHIAKSANRCAQVL